METIARRFSSLRAQLAVALALFCLLLAGAVGFILYELDLRKHDYRILNLAGQMRVTATNLKQIGEEHLGRSTLDLLSKPEINTLFLRHVRDHASLYDQIITAFKNRELSPELIGSTEALRCNWDANSRNQLDISADDWRGYQLGLESSFGNDPRRPNSFGVASYLVANGAALIESTENLTKAFQTMMEGKLLLIRYLVAGMLVAGVVLGLLLILVLRARVLKPLDATVAAFDRVAQGDLGLQIEPAGSREIAHMTEAFNHLSERLHAIFRLTDRINRGMDLSETLSFVVEEFRSFLPVEWAAVLLASPNPGHYSVERVHGAGLKERLQRMVCSPLLDLAVREEKAVVHDSPPGGLPGCDLTQGFADLGLQSALLLPLTELKEGGAVLVFASSQPGAYTMEHRTFLESVGAQVSHILSKTVVMEGLVVAAVEGLAKLAESRDPETGDHLIRMSLYSMILAEEMGNSPAYARAIHAFAPMHDIGKVGISDDILLKPGRLNDEERAEMCRHPAIGGQVLRTCEAHMNERGRSVFKLGIDIAECHHEKWDGTGYPKGLTGEAIPVAARIVAVADVFDALTSKRPYKEAWTVEKALETLEKDAGTHFDPGVIAIMKSAMPRILEIYERLKHV
jgi:HD-GYP domain-containing protein (c-di-GMP phosphodiesterase class II)